MMMDMGAGVQQQGMQPQPDWCASCSSRCCAHLGAHASTHLIGDTARGSPPHMGADWSSGDCANDEGDWRGSPPMPQQQLVQQAPATASFPGMAPRPQKRHSDAAFSPSKRPRPLCESSFVCNLQHDMQL